MILKDLVAEKAEAERLVNEVVRLEREKLELSRELSAYQEETSERRGRSTTDSPDGSTEKVEELVEVVRQKNKHIMQLLDDIETADQENNALRVKLTTARNEITEANNTISEMTQQITSLNIASDDSKIHCKDVEDKNKALISQVDELIEKKAANDRDLDDFALKLNERVEEWKRLLDAKDSEMVSLKEELEKYETKPWNDSSAEPRAKLQIIQLEKEVSELQAVIHELNMENEGREKYIASLRKSMSENEETKKAYNQIENLHETIDQLQEQLKMLEEDTVKKDEEISELVIQLRGYERGEFGLTEAVEKIKLLERRSAEKETKIENLVATLNKLTLDRDNLEDENIFLREKMGLSPSRTILHASAVKTNSNAQVVSNLRLQIEALQNDVINLKLRNRELSQRETTPSDESKSENTVGERDLRMIEENDALRKGLHEILESIQTQTMGDLQIKSLENLLEALDARHVSGWYHPAMRLQAQLQTIRGECQALRVQVKELKTENATFWRDSEAAKAVVIALEDKIQMHGPGNEEITKLEHVEDDLEWQRKCVSFQLAAKQANLSLDEAKLAWEKEKRKLIKDRDEFAARVREQGEPESSSDTSYLTKTISFLRKREEILENELDELQTAYLQMENESLSKLIGLENEKAHLMIRNRALENQFLFFEPVEKAAELEKELSFIKLQYSQAISSVFPAVAEAKIPSVALSDDQEVDELLKELKNVKEKLHDAEAQLNCFGDSATPDAFHNELSILSSKLADCEVQMMNERTKRNALEKYLSDVNKVKTEQEITIKDLSEQVQELSKVNSKFQEALFDLEYRMKTNFAEKHAESNDKVESLVQDKRNLEELLELSRNQLRSLHVFKESKRIEYDVWQEFNLNPSNENFARELIAEKKKCLDLNQRNEEAQAVISRLLSENLSKESQLIAVVSEVHHVKETFIQQFKMLYKLLYNVHDACSNAFCFPTINRARRIINTLEDLQEKLSEKFSTNEHLGKTWEIKNDEMQVQLEALHDLKAAFQSDPKNLVGWHNRTTELRLKESRLKRHNQFLTEEVRKLEQQVKRLKNDGSAMEDKMMERERDWQEKQKQWEVLQLSLCGLVDKKFDPVRSEDNSAVSQLESKVTDLELQNMKLLEELEQRESVFREKLSEKIYRSKSSPEKKVLSVGFDGESEVKALAVTVSSLQAIVKQKEETISRYQELLKKGREDHSNAIRRLQNELKNVHNALAQESKAHSRMKHGVYQPAAADIEKYVITVQELEERVMELQSNIGRLSSQLKSSQHETQQLKKVVNEKESLFGEDRERMEAEIERYRGEVQNYQLEVEQLRELAQGGQTKILIDQIADLQKKLSKEQVVRPVSAKKIEPDLNESVENVKRQLKASREECSRLREQIENLRALKRRPSANKLLDKENLVDKIRKLEETLQLSKQHEQELEERGLKRIKSVEEVTRWDERKRHQKTVEKLLAKAKQKEVDATVANNKLETMRGLLIKLERDKAMLEAQVKNLSGKHKTFETLLAHTIFLKILQRRVAEWKSWQLRKQTLLLTLPLLRKSSLLCGCMKAEKLWHRFM